MIALNILVSFIVIVALQIIGMVIFNWITPFNDMEELRKGNKAVGLALGGKFFGTAIILGVAAYTNSSIFHMALWFGIGYVCLLLTYFVFDLLTPGIKLSEQLKEGNVAVGIMLFAIYVGVAFSMSSLII